MHPSSRVYDLPRGGGILLRDRETGGGLGQGRRSQLLRLSSKSSAYQGAKLPGAVLGATKRRENRQQDWLRREDAYEKETDKQRKGGLEVRAGCVLVLPGEV